MGMLCKGVRSRVKGVRWVVVIECLNDGEIEKRLAIRDTYFRICYFKKNSEPCCDLHDGLP